jgi:hypothetical protein
MHIGRPSAALLLSTLLLIAGSTAVRAQRAAGSESNIDPMFLIDTPTAGMLPTTAGSADLYMYPDGGVVATLVYAPLRNINVGISYGGTRIIGSGGILWNPWPGVMFRYRLIEESVQYPAIVAGFDSQGQDGWVPGDIDGWRQYVIKSPGIFVAASKNYAFYGMLSFHGGLGYTLERNDRDYSPNLWLGAEKSVGSVVSLLAEYNFAFDNDKGRKGFWNGSLNTGVRVSTHIGLNLDIYFKNLVTSSVYKTPSGDVLQDGTPLFSGSHLIRALRVQYVRYL